MDRINWHEPGLIPQLLFFQNGNVYTGSSKAQSAEELRFKMKPEDGKIVVELWPGPFCYEKSEIAHRAEFPMDEEGRARALDWMNEKYNA